MIASTAMISGYTLSYREFVGYTKVVVTDPNDITILQARLTQHQIHGLFQVLSVLADPDYMKSKITLVDL